MSEHNGSNHEGGRFDRLFGHRNGRAGGAARRPTLIRLDDQSEDAEPKPPALQGVGLVLALCGTLLLAFGFWPRR